MVVFGHFVFKSLFTFLYVTCSFLDILQFLSISHLWIFRFTAHINKILENCLEINPVWLITGKGEMLNHSYNDTPHNINSYSKGDNNICISSPEIKDKSRDEQSLPVQANENNIYTEMIATQRELIDSLKEQISQYRKEIEYLIQRIKEK